MAVTKRLVITLSLLSVISSFAFSSFAHSGSTDSKGGHYDRDAGDYHYHHGYPAHDHYDMDGDGDKDCPYNYDDDTNHNQGGVAQIEKDKTEHKVEAVYTTKNNTPKKTASEKESNTNFDVGKYINALIPSLVISFPLSLIIYCVLEKFNDNIKDKSFIWIYTILTLIISIAMYQSN